MPHLGILHFIHKAVPPTLCLLLLCCLSANAQRTSIGIGINGEYGYTHPTYTRGGLSALAPLFTYTRSGPNVENKIWWNYENEQSDKIKLSYAGGLSFLLRHKTRRRNFFTWETGFNHARLAYYFDNNNYFSTPNSFQPISALQEWYHLHQAHSNIQLSFGLPNAKGIQIYSKMGGTYSWVTGGLLPNGTSAHKGIEDSGIRVWSGDAGSQLIMADAVNPEKVWGVVGGLGLALHFGRYDNHSLHMGMMYYYSLGNHVESNYVQTDAFGNLTSEDNIDYQGHHLAYEFSYKFPLITFGRSRRNNSKFGTLYVELSPNGAINSGAMWRVGATGPWQKSGSAIKLRQGTHTLQFRNISGWVTPQAQTVYVSANQTNYAKGAYYKKGSTPPPVTPTPPSSTPSMADLEDDMKSCFRSKNTNLLTWHEDDAKINSDKLELDFFDADGDNDGDRISVCIDGDLVLKNHELSDAGTIIKVDMPTKTGDVIFVMVYTHNKGGSGRNAVGVEMPKGGKMKTIEWDLDEDQYYYFRLVRQ